MEKLQEIEKTIEKIEAEKEILSTMPKNNEKNEQKYLEKVEALKKEYEKYKEEIEVYLKSEYASFTDVKEDEEIELLKSTINNVHLSYK